MEEYLLGLGDRFRITTLGPSTEDFTRDLQTFSNKVRWFDTIHNGPTPVKRTPHSYIPKFHLNTGRQPRKDNPIIEATILELQTHGMDIHRNLRKRPLNLTQCQQKIVNDLKTNQNIVIVNADKGLGAVVLNSKNYYAEADLLLADESTYERTPQHCLLDLENEISHQLGVILDNHKDFIDAKDVKGFLSCFPFKPAKFHLLPKLHKTFTAVGQPKCRPIVSSIGYCTSPASRYVDHHLKQYVCKAETVLSNSTQVINELQKQVSFQDCHFLTADVVSLYTNMSWKCTVGALQTFLEEIHHPLTSLLIDLVNFVLRNNYFVFQDIVYHQTKGMAMGTPMAVNIANLFLFMHERSTLRSFPRSIQYFGRYVDDIILLINNSFDIVALKSCLYSELPEIRLTWSDTAKNCVFLDLQLSINKNSLEFSTYQISRNAYLYIPFSSDHPRS